jgi:hypothetical protein
VRAAALVLVALALSGCETTAEKAAKLEKVAKRHAREAPPQVQHGLSIARVSTKVKVGPTTILRSSEGAAVVVTLRNTSATPLRNVPVEITVRDAHGASLYANTVPGLAPGLVSAPLLAAHSELRWVDDQVQLSGSPASAVAKVGEAAPFKGAVPRLSVAGTHVVEDPTNGPTAEGTVINASGVSQQELIVYAIATRAGKIVAAGRAIVPEAPAHSSTRFQLFFIGDPRGATVAFSAPATTLG